MPGNKSFSRGGIHLYKVEHMFVFCVYTLLRCVWKIFGCFTNKYWHFSFEQFWKCLEESLKTSFMAFLHGQKGKMSSQFSSKSHQKLVVHLPFSILLLNKMGIWTAITASEKKIITFLANLLGCNLVQCESGNLEMHDDDDCNPSKPYYWSWWRSWLLIFKIYPMCTKHLKMVISVKMPGFYLKKIKQSGMARVHCLPCNVQSARKNPIFPHRR